MADSIAIDKAEAGNRVVLGTFDWTQSCVVTPSALWTQQDGGAATAKLLVELLPKGFAEQVESERIHARVGEGKDTCAHAGDEMGHWGVHFCVMVGPVEVNHMVRKPADGKETHKHQHCLGKPYPWLNLWFTNTDITCAEKLKWQTVLRSPNNTSKLKCAIFQLKMLLKKLYSVSTFWPSWHNNTGSTNDVILRWG